MGKEAGHSMEPILRHSHVLRELLQSFLLQIAELLLNPVQGGHEHRRIQRQPFDSHVLIGRRIQCQSTVGWCNCFLRDLRPDRSPSRLRVGRQLMHRMSENYKVWAALLCRCSNTPSREVLRKRAGVEVDR